LSFRDAVSVNLNSSLRSATNIVVCGREVVPGGTGVPPGGRGSAAPRRGA
jgi:hypothetical protein